MNDLRAIELSDNEVIFDLRETIGTEHTLAFLKKFGGTQLYVPKPDTVNRQVRDEEIFKKYMNGTSYRSLAVQYHVSENRIRSIVNEMRKMH